ncbi:hypothetical protein C9I92_19515 [Photobacterium ganghwense]|uniref:Uncharacterized protein n=1 Tax=Photobacterium ganghwense TaxID=320778 RepID=A0A0J1H1G9_9GAMM|nr:hypothetical protein ABT57_20835 [Photobacterium ganghwense]PSU06201.1 hypothetical protein C9I92_19515 [Photobacterium ganghwense]
MVTPEKENQWARKLAAILSQLERKRLRLRKNVKFAAVYAQNRIESEMFVRGALGIRRRAGVFW